MKKNILWFIAALILGIALSLTDAHAADLTLSWTDNSNNESGFRIERRINGAAYSGTFASVGANIVSYVDKTPTVNPTSDTTYCYRVLAFNSAGVSGYSNEGCATLKQPLPTAPAVVDIKCTACTVTVNGVTTTIP